MTMSKSAPEEQLLFLSEKLDRRVWRSPLMTGAWHNDIWLEAKYADHIEQGGKLNAAMTHPRRKAKAIYHLLHEFAHTRQQFHLYGKEEYLGQESEDDANHYAAKNFRFWCRQLGFNKAQTWLLWRALPRHYKEA